MPVADRVGVAVALEPADRVGVSPAARVAAARLWAAIKASNANTESDCHASAHLIVVTPFRLPYRVAARSCAEALARVLAAPKRRPPLSVSGYPPRRRQIGADRVVTLGTPSC